MLRPTPRWYLGRYIRVLTSTGRWEFMRITEVSPLHFVVKDATGREYLVGRSKG